MKLKAEISYLMKTQKKLLASFYVYITFWNFILQEQKRKNKFGTKYGLLQEEENNDNNHTNYNHLFNHSFWF